MWTMTKYGFFSAVCARKGDGAPGQKVDPDKVMVRARDAAHLENLIERFPEWLNGHKVHESDDSDYPCRIFMQKSIWQRIVSDIIEEMDYDNFKSEVHRSKLTDPRYEDALMSTWGTMHKVSPPKAGEALAELQLCFGDAGKEWIVNRTGAIYRGWRESGTANNASHWFSFQGRGRHDPYSESE